MPDDCAWCLAAPSIDGAASHELRSAVSGLRPWRGELGRDGPRREGDSQPGCHGRGKTAARVEPVGSAREEAAGAGSQHLTVGLRRGLLAGRVAARGRVLGVARHAVVRHVHRHVHAGHRVLLRTRRFRARCMGGIDARRPATRQQQLESERSREDGGGEWGASHRGDDDRFGSTGTLLRIGTRPAEVQSGVGRDFARGIPDGEAGSPDSSRFPSRVAPAAAAAH